MAVGAVLVFEGGCGLDYDAVVERLRTRLHLIPRYRQRLASPVPGVAQPEWVDDEHFDLAWHVRHVALPAPGGTPSWPHSWAPSSRASSIETARCGSSV